MDTEEDDRVKYREQLDIVGNLARVNMGHTLKHYTAFLLHRTRALASRIESQEECNPVSSNELYYLDFQHSVSY